MISPIFSYARTALFSFFCPCRFSTRVAPSLSWPIVVKVSFAGQTIRFVISLLFRSFCIRSVSAWRARVLLKSSSWTVKTGCTRVSAFCLIIDWCQRRSSFIAKVALAALFTSVCVFICVSSCRTVNTTVLLRSSLRVNHIYTSCWTFFWCTTSNTAILSFFTLVWRGNLEIWVSSRAVVTSWTVFKCFLVGTAVRTSWTIALFRRTLRTPSPIFASYISSGPF